MHQLRVDQIGLIGQQNMVRPRQSIAQALDIVNNFIICHINQCQNQVRLGDFLTRAFYPLRFDTVA